MFFTIIWTNSKFGVNQKPLKNWKKSQKFNCFW